MYVVEIEKVLVQAILVCFVFSRSLSKDFLSKLPSEINPIHKERGVEPEFYTPFRQKCTQRSHLYTPYTFIILILSATQCWMGMQLQL